MASLAILLEYCKPCASAKDWQRSKVILHDTTPGITLNDGFDKRHWLVAIHADQLPRRPHAPVVLLQHVSKKSPPVVLLQHVSKKSPPVVLLQHVSKNPHL